MIRLLLMALGAYTLYRIYAPLDSEAPRKIVDQRPPANRPARRGVKR